jgi:hypothetical protein
MNRILKFWSSTRLEKLLLFEAVILLLLSALCVKIIPFKGIYSFLQRRFAYVKIDGYEVSNCSGDTIERTVCRAANGLPWRNLCLAQSIAAFIMLRRRGIPAVMLTGVKVLKNSSLSAHAWVNTGEETTNSDFTVVLKIGQRFSGGQSSL